MARRNTIFFKPTHKRLAKIVSLKSPARARASIKKLDSLFRKALTRASKRTIKRATVLAGNRAGAQLQRTRLSMKERKEFTQIQKIYLGGSKLMRLGI